MKSYCLLSAVLIFSFSVEAKYRFTSGDRARATAQGNQHAAQISETTQEGKGTQAAGYQSFEQSARDTMNNSQKGQTTTRVMQVGMYAAGAAYSAGCGPHSLHNCVKAAIMFYMGSQAGKSADSFQIPIDDSQRNICTYSTLGCGNSPENPYTAALTPAVINTGKASADADKIKVALNKGGYEVDPNSGKIKTPKGELDANDRASLASALGEDGLNELMNKVKDLEKDAKAKVDQIKAGTATAALGFEGGGGSIGEVNDEGYGDVDGAASAISNLAKQRKPAAQAKGLTKNFNGDPIGVAADSIFEMMSRRYQLKNNQKTFFGPEVQ